MEDAFLAVENIAVSYGKIRVLTGVSFDVPQGSITALLGANGAGKSTTLNAISGVVRPEKGRITLSGEDITLISPNAVVEKGLIQVPEERRLFPAMSVLENLELGAYTPRARRSRMERMERVLSLFPILRERQKQIARTLSGGEQQMLAIGRSLMALPQLLMLDEPSLGLAPKIIDDLFEAIRQINREGVTILLVEQNVYRSLELSSFAYILEEGKIALSGHSESLIDNDYVREAYLGM